MERRGKEEERRKISGNERKTKSKGTANKRKKRKNRDEEERVEEGVIQISLVVLG